MNFQERIISNPNICGGERIIKGTRVTLRSVLASLAEGATIEDICKDFPTLSESDVRAVIAFAASAAEDDVPLPAMPRVA
jgi:uncharacterized protein (DUF433 family)